jgi:Tol biopolymer transport system component
MWREQRRPAIWPYRPVRLAGGRPHPSGRGEDAASQDRRGVQRRCVLARPNPGCVQHGSRRDAIRTLKSGRTTLVPNQPSQDRFLSGDLAWAPDGRRLAFVNDETIYTISVNGNDLRKVAQGAFPSWTKDGKHIVFVSGWNGNTAVGDIDVSGVDGTGLRSLGRGLYPEVSPAGDDVAYSTPVGVFVRPLARGDPRLVAPNGFGPVWSPDGMFLAFIRYTTCGEGACSGRVFIVPVKGGTPHAVGPTMGDPGQPGGWIR